MSKTNHAKRREILRKMEKHRRLPDWFGPSLGAAQHQDQINSWPWWARFLHRTLRSKKCPACQYWLKMQSPHAQTR